MWSQRSVIDYALARRATLADLFGGRASTLDVCDAHPYLLRAAKHHGEPTEDECPVCRKERLTHVTYVYGDELGESSGRTLASKSLARIEAEYAEVAVYVVEVCRGCGWNHLTTSFVVGHGRVPERAGAGVRRARRTGAPE
ncbi:MAG: hypothetical protein QOF57_2342 [Frankiaceae bacterium]|jgi:hypothetical protein|nr:hypothetical protein [Frankiaceae bacterium]MDQ1727449.1 hypothetical protein [Frankiaceae bacterium]